ncbi:unnamed protein product [Adineta steineri]|uniref:Uncharacterized protein n=1 Tax=Adineta steineri TaxID=433720 RepID=A0A819TCB7_9BILA|nr:unnamed protein product [Adineta steineri]CAF4070570.1 unnamed protein product [Adineta steineri]
MPNKCSTLVRRRQDILNQLSRSNSEGKLQDDILETTAELCIAGTRKAPPFFPTPTHHVPTTPTTRRSNFLPTNRVHPSPNQVHNTQLPTIRYAKGSNEQRNHIQDETHSRSTRSKTPLDNSSPKSGGYTPSASMSSVYNALSKRSTENLLNAYAGSDNKNSSNPVSPSYRSQRSHKTKEIKKDTTKHTTALQKQSTDSGIDIRFSSSSGDTNHLQRTSGTSTRPRTNTQQVQNESPRTQETVTKDRTNHGQLYQRRPNNAAKAPIKQKIDKYRRRTEVTQAIYGYTSINAANNDLPNTNYSTSNRPKPPPSTPTMSGGTMMSAAKLQAHHDALFESLKSKAPYTYEPLVHYSHQYSPNPVKSPHLCPKHQQITSTLPISNPPTPLVHLRPSYGTIQNFVPTKSSHHNHHHHHTNTKNNQYLPTPPPPPSQQYYTIKQTPNASPKYLSLASAAPHNPPTLDDNLLNDADQQKLLRVFKWLKNVEEHRYEQIDHDELLDKQTLRMIDQTDNLSLYSEIRLAVDDLPPNLSNEPCERIATMEFEN